MALPGGAGSIKAGLGKVFGWGGGAAGNLLRGAGWGAAFGSAIGAGLGAATDNEGWGWKGAMFGALAGAGMRGMTNKNVMSASKEFFGKAAFRGERGAVNTQKNIMKTFSSTEKDDVSRMFGREGMIGSTKTFQKHAEQIAAGIGGAKMGAIGGAAVGAAYGVWSDRDSMISGAMKGALMGAVAGGVYRGGFQKRFTQIPGVRNQTIAMQGRRQAAMISASNKNGSPVYNLKIGDAFGGSKSTDARFNGKLGNRINAVGSDRAAKHQKELAGMQQAIGAVKEHGKIVNNGLNELRKRKDLLDFGKVGHDKAGQNWKKYYPDLDEAERTKKWFDIEAAIPELEKKAKSFNDSVNSNFVTNKKGEPMFGVFNSNMSYEEKNKALYDMAL